MPKLELNFLPDDCQKATDEQLLLQLVYGLCKSLDNPKEERSPFFVSSFGLPLPVVRRAAKLIAEKCELPIPELRVDEWIEWHCTNHAWIVNEEMSKRASELATIS